MLSLCTAARSSSSFWWMHCKAFLPRLGTRVVPKPSSHVFAKTNSLLCAFREEPVLGGLSLVLRICIARVRDGLRIAASLSINMSRNLRSRDIASRCGGARLPMLLFVSSWCSSEEGRSCAILFVKCLSWSSVPFLLTMWKRERIGVGGIERGSAGRVVVLSRGECCDLPLPGPRFSKEHHIDRV